MQTVRRIETLRQQVRQWRMAGERMALVPTMGALHAGHIALVTEARRQADRVVASIFVNPRQFGPNEDLARYPRREAEDAAMLDQAGCDLLWAPDVDTMYPAGYATSISVAGVSEGLCGAARPGHFDGVTTVVAKLFNQVQPDVALFGEKDYQQLAVIRRMTLDLNLPVEIVGVPTVREVDGLALSSRNAYLSAEQRQVALALPAVLQRTGEALRQGDVARLLTQAHADLLAAGFDSVDYIELRDAETLAPLQTDKPRRLLAAARIGGTRLIDNLPVPATA